MIQYDYNLVGLEIALRIVLPIFILLLVLTVSSCNKTDQPSQNGMYLAESLQYEYTCDPKFQNASRFHTNNQFVASKKILLIPCTTIEDYIFEQEYSYVFVKLHPDEPPEISTSSENNKLTNSDFDNFDTIFLTGGAHEFWNSGCTDFWCFDEVATRVQRVFYDFIKSNELNFEKVVYIENIKIQKRDAFKSSRKHQIARQALLIAMFQQLELKLKGSRFIGILPLDQRPTMH